MSDSGFDLKRDGLGIVLFALGAFFAVLGGYAVLLAVQSGADHASATGTNAVAQAWIDGIGVIPGLVLSVGVAFVGARIWLSGRAKRVAPQILAFAGLALATAVLAGALSPNAGGSFGFATGGLVSESVHPIAGMLAGAVAVAAALWFGWLRPAQGEDQDEPTLIRNPDLPDLAFDDFGVSADEAAALIPEDFTRSPKAPRKQARPPAEPPPSPYPEDVRRQGKIPAGARPLSRATAEDAPPDAQPAVSSLAESAAAAATVYRWTAARTDRPVGAGEDLAPVPEARGVFDVVEPAPAPARGASEADPFALKSESEVAASQALDPLPPPSWEQSNLFVEEDEPVDAYGTPLSLVDALRRSQQEVSEAFADPEGTPEPPLGLAAGDLEADLQEDGDEGAELEDAVAGELDEEELDEDVEGDLEEDFDEEELDPEQGLEVEVDEELEVDEDELDLGLEPAAAAEDEPELETRPERELAGAPTGLVVEDTTAQGHHGDPEAGLGVGVTEEVVEIRPEAARAPQRELEIPAAAVRADEPAHDLRAGSAPMLPFQPVEDGRTARVPSRGRTAAPVAGAASATPAATPALHAGLASAPSSRASSTPARENAAPRASERERAAPSGARSPAAERQVILQPQAVSAERATKPLLAGDSRGKLLREAGALFLDRGRVAVSMLQREYAMDFDEACRVLDELQELGLIGPYLGGQRRDILMTREQWLERVAKV